MANATYGNGRAGILGGGVDFDTDDQRLVFVDEADDTIDLTNDDFLNDRAAGSRVATSTALAGISISAAGVIDATDHTVTVASGQDPFESIDWYKHTGNEATARLLFNLDTATGLPCTPASGGQDVLVQFDNGGNKVYNWSA